MSKFTHIRCPTSLTLDVEPHSC